MQVLKATEVRHIDKQAQRSKGRNGKLFIYKILTSVSPRMQVMRIR